MDGKVLLGALGTYFSVEGWPGLLLMGQWMSMDKLTVFDFYVICSALVVRGKYPKTFLSAWDRFKRENGTESDRPGKQR